jgi:hypothetical protein
MIAKLIQKEEHLTRFFGTNWNSRISIVRYKNHPEWGWKFRNGYCELSFGLWKIRYRNNK